MGQSRTCTSSGGIFYIVTQSRFCTQEGLLTCNVVSRGALPVYLEVTCDQK